MSSYPPLVDGSPPDDGVTCRVSPFGVEIAVGCPASLLDAIAHLLSAWNPRLTAGSRETCVRITSCVAEASGPRYALVDKDTVRLPSATADEVLVGLQHWFDAEVTRRVRHLTPVHAGVVGWRDRAIVLPAPSGAGKTTLISALGELGATYYSDEFAFLDARGWVHPYPRHLVVRAADGVPRTLASAQRSAAALPPIPPRLILALQFDPSAPFHLDRVPSSECLLGLLANTPHRIASIRDVPAGLLQAAGMAAAYRGTRGEARQAGAAILALAGRAAL